MKLNTKCKNHDGQLTKAVCIDINCKHKHFVCENCLQENHKDHIFVNQEDYLQSLYNQSKEIHEILPKFEETCEQTTNLHVDTKTHIDSFLEEFQQGSQAINNLYQFNKDLSLKNLQKDIVTLESMKKIQEKINQIQQQGEISEQDQLFIEENQKYFINLIAMKKMDNPDYSMEQIIEKFMFGMSYKRGLIEKFNSKIKNVIETEITTMRQSLDRLKQAEIDIIEYLETELADLIRPEYQSIMVCRDSLRPTHFARFEVLKKEIENKGQEALKQIISDFYQVDTKDLSIKSLQDLQEIKDDYFYKQLMGQKKLICELNSKIEKISDKVIVIGISGPTRAGKGTLSNHLKIALDGELITQDLYFDKHKIYTELNGNWEIPEAVRWEELIKDIQDKIESMRKSPKQQFLILEGFLLFSNKKINELCDLKIFLDLNEKEIYTRRMRTKPVPEDYFHNFVIPGFQTYKNSISQQKAIHILNGSSSVTNLFSSSMQLIDELKKASLTKQQ